jgi:hypothetical protein
MLTQELSGLSVLLYLKRNSYLGVDKHTAESIKDPKSYLFEALRASKFFSAEITVIQVQFRTEV